MSYIGNNMTDDELAALRDVPVGRNPQPRECTCSASCADECACGAWSVVRDFEERITPHILRNWDRRRIVAFAKHLLGDECQECPVHGGDAETVPQPRECTCAASCADECACGAWGGRAS